MAQYKLAHIDMKGNRGELHDLLNLTGAEVSWQHPARRGQHALCASPYPE